MTHLPQTSAHIILCCCYSSCYYYDVEWPLFQDKLGKPVSDR